MGDSVFIERQVKPVRILSVIVYSNAVLSNMIIKFDIIKIETNGSLVLAKEVSRAETSNRIL